MDEKEIYEAVLSDCMAQIEKIKIEYGEELVESICNRLSKQYSSQMDIIEEQYEDIIERLRKLEVKHLSNEYEGMDVWIDGDIIYFRDEDDYNVIHAYRSGKER